MKAENENLASKKNRNWIAKTSDHARAAAEDGLSQLSICMSFVKKTRRCRPFPVKQ